MKKMLAVIALFTAIAPFAAGCVADASDPGDEITTDVPEIDALAAGPVLGPGTGTIGVPTKPKLIACSTFDGIRTIITSPTDPKCTATVVTSNCRSDGNGGCTCDYTVESTSGCH
ncbi:MAG: hypothetical protein QM820_05020 [Minicystis sp.]